MSEEDENACGKVGCYYYVEDYKCSNDHVSKSELIKWCEAVLKTADNSPTLSGMLKLILEKFCAGEK